MPIIEPYLSNQQQSPERRIKNTKQPEIIVVSRHQLHYQQLKNRSHVKGTELQNVRVSMSGEFQKIKHFQWPLLNINNGISNDIKKVAEAQNDATS